MKKRWRDTAVRPAGNRELKAKLERASAKLSVLNEAFDRDRAREHREAGIVERVSCGKSADCTGCCYQLLPSTSQLEGLHIVLKHRALVEEVEPELRRQKALAAEQGVDQINPFDQGSMERFADQWFRQGVPCAFLDLEAKRCRIYEDRPSACRDYTLLDYPPEVCKPPGIDEKVPGWISNALHTLLMHQLLTMKPIARGNFVIGPLPAQVLGWLDRFRAEGF